MTILLDNWPCKGALCKFTEITSLNITKFYLRKIKHSQNLFSIQYPFTLHLCNQTSSVRELAWFGHLITVCIQLKTWVIEVPTIAGRTGGVTCRCTWWSHTSTSGWLAPRLKILSRHTNPGSLYTTTVKERPIISNIYNKEQSKTPWDLSNTLEYISSDTKKCKWSKDCLP